MEWTQFGLLADFTASPGPDEKKDLSDGLILGNLPAHGGLETGPECRRGGRNLLQRRLDPDGTIASIGVDTRLIPSV